MWLVIRRGGFDYYEPIMTLKTREILMLYNKDGLVLYDPKLGGFKKLSIYWIKSEFYRAAHIPSLVSLCDVAEGEYFSLIRYQRTKEFLGIHYSCSNNFISFNAPFILIGNKNEGMAIRKTSSKQKLDVRYYVAEQKVYV
ncbi:hypothetical protein ACSBR2_011961 [Camellia fascicularis]